MAIQYKRILLKVSGEALSGPKGTGFDEETIASICAGIKAAHAADSQALIQLRQHYCDGKDCLRCQFGALYLKQGRS